MKTLTPQQAFDALENNQALLIDVRETQEFEEMHIQSAQLAPLSTLPESIQAIDFKDKKDKKIIFQCLKGGRSAQAIEYLENSFLQGYDIYNLEGGILAWVENGLPVTPSTE